jgi:hypothetical protein
MWRFGIFVSGVGILLGALLIVFAIYADANNGCENGPCGSPLVLVIPGVDTDGGAKKTKGRPPGRPLAEASACVLARFHQASEEC